MQSAIGCKNVSKPRLSLRPAQGLQQQSLPRPNRPGNRWHMSTAAAVAGDGGAVQAVEAGPAAAAGGHPAAGAAADGDGGQQGQHYNEVADNYEAGE